ncbi:MAG: AraC family transcriptional regulator [Verrucomicrobiota bacterium]
MPRPARQSAILATHVSGSRYFFLGLADEPRASLIPAYGGFERCDPDYLVQREHFPFPTLELVTDGVGQVRLNGQEFSLRAGSLFAYDRTTRLEIRTDSRQPLAKYFLSMRRGARAQLHAAGLEPGALVQLARFADVQRLWDDLIREGGHHRPMAGRLCAALVAVLLLKIEDLTGLPATPGWTAEDDFVRCKRLIEEQTVSLDTLSEITRATGIGPTRLSRLFRRYQGLSPYQFLLRCKMARAAELLMNPDTLVKEAAAKVGFADPYHFSRCFKQVYQVAPKGFQSLLKHRGGKSQEPGGEEN